MPEPHHVLDMQLQLPGVETPYAAPMEHHHAGEAAAI